MIGADSSVEPLSVARQEVLSEHIPFIEFYREVLEQARPEGATVMAHNSTHAEQVTEGFLAADSH